MLHLLLLWCNGSLVRKQCHSAQHLLQASGLSISYGSDGCLAGCSNLELPERTSYVTVEEGDDVQQLTHSEDMYSEVEPV